MAKYKVSELEGPDLNACVHNALMHSGREVLTVGIPRLIPYSTQWSRGGPIIESERITIDQTVVSSQGVIWARCPAIREDVEWSTTYMSGHTPLIAAMRAYVGKTFGKEVELP